METKPGYPDDDRCRLTQKASGDFSFWDPSDPDMEVTLTPEMLGIPREIKIIPPNMPDIKIVHDLLDSPEDYKIVDGYKLITISAIFYGPGEIDQIRKAIMDCLYQLPEHKTELNIPKWIGSPPLEEIIKVKGDILRTMAYYDWEKAGKPEGKDNEFWFKAEERFDGALSFWF